jgi:hypothetical protein
MSLPISGEAVAEVAAMTAEWEAQVAVVDSVE